VTTSDSKLKQTRQLPSGQGQLIMTGSNQQHQDVYSNPQWQRPTFTISQPRILPLHTPTLKSKMYHLGLRLYDLWYLNGYRGFGL